MDSAISAAIERALAELDTSDWRRNPWLAMERAAKIVEMDQNTVLDQLYCCTAMDGSAQVCACEGVSIREEISWRIRALLDQPASDTVTVPAEPTPDMVEAGAEYLVRLELGAHPYAGEKGARMGTWCRRVFGIYRAMLAARSQP